MPNQTTNSIQRLSENLTNSPHAAQLSPAAAGHRHENYEYGPRPRKTLTRRPALRRLSALEGWPG